MQATWEGLHVTELANSPEEVWGRALDLLKTQMERAAFDFWLARTWVVEMAPGSNGQPGDWVIGVTNARAQEWLTHRLAPLITRTLSWTAGEPASVQFVVAQREIVRPAPNRHADRHRARPIEEEPALKGAGPAPETARKGPGPAGEGVDLVWTDFYIKLKVAFRKRALRKLKGARLSVFLCLALHVDRDGIAKPGGIEAIMHETGYSRGAVCSALEELASAGLIRRLRQHRGADQYRVLGYAWFGEQPAPALWESEYEK